MGMGNWSRPRRSRSRVEDLTPWSPGRPKRVIGTPSHSTLPLSARPARSLKALPRVAFNDVSANQHCAQAHSAFPAEATLALSASCFPFDVSMDLGALISSCTYKQRLDFDK